MDKRKKKNGEIRPSYQELMRNIKNAFPGFGIRRLARAFNVSQRQVRKILEADEEAPAATKADPWRCRGCGAMIQIDRCLACQLQKPSAAELGSNATEGPDETAE